MKNNYSVNFKMVIYAILFLFTAVHLSAQRKSQFPKSVKQLDVIYDLTRNLLLSDTAYSTEQSYRLTDDVIYTADAKGYFQSFTAEGNWADIDYNSAMPGAWRPSWHLYRLMLLIREYQKNKDPQYLNAVHRGLAFWIKNDFKSKNWWHNNINTPFAYSSLIIMLGKDVNEQEMEFLDKVIVKRIPVYKATGQNLLWQLDNEARVALIHRDETSFQKIVKEMQSVVVISTSEGIQPDYSFHQHGPMLQFGNYGLHFVNTILFWMRVTVNTTFAFDVEKQKIIFDYCSKGLRWTVYNTAMDVTAAGRQIRNNYTLKRGITLNDDFNLLKSFDNSDSCKYYLDGFGNRNSVCELHGNKGFWRSDYMSYLSGQNYMMSVKMNGPFVNKVESINTENLKGSFLNDGVCLIRRTGKEYKNIEALWNWDMLPGITCDTSFDPAAKTIFQTRNNSLFVGQVSDGVTGVCSMCYNRLGITAFKSYFFINDMHIALGTGISSKNQSNLVTTVNQCFYRNSNLIRGTGNNTEYVWHDSIAYFFPGAQELKTNTAFRRANWKEIDGASSKVEEDSLVSIFLGHNNSNTYAYIIKPGMSIEQAKKMNENLPVRILSNTKSLQAIQSGNTVQAVFFEPGVLHISENNDLSSEQACILIYRSGGKEISVADPTRKLSDITLSINGKKINIALPKGDYLGSTIKIVDQKLISSFTIN